MRPLRTSLFLFSVALGTLFCFYSASVLSSIAVAKTYIPEAATEYASTKLEKGLSAWRAEQTSEVEDLERDDEDEDSSRDLSSSLVEAPLPRVNFTAYAKYPPHNVKATKKFAYATLLCTPEPHPKDPFFAAAQQLVWRILWSNWHSKYPMIIFCCPSTPQWQRDTLAGQGAIIEEIELISGVIDPSTLHLARWRDQLTKLNMWKYTNYHRIVFLDSDAFPIRNMDDLFDLVPKQRCRRNLLSADDKKHADALCEYTFGGAITSNEHNLNGGVFLFSPNVHWHAKFMRDVLKTDEYDYKTAEQGLLDSSLGFGLDGPYPRHTFSQHYNADEGWYNTHRYSSSLSSDSSSSSFASLYPKAIYDTVIDAVRVVHCKMWSPFSITWAPELSVRWDSDWMDMCRWYDSNLFTESRRTGRRKEPLEAMAEAQERAERRERRKKQREQQQQNQQEQQAQIQQRQKSQKQEVVMD